MVSEEGVGQSSASEIYQTANSNAKSQAGRHAKKRLSQGLNARPHIRIQEGSPEEEKRNCQDFLDEDIEQIDKLLRHACADGNEYGGPRQPSHYAPRRPAKGTGQNFLQPATA